MKKMKVKYNNLRDRVYTELDQIKFDIEFLENLSADYGKGLQDDLKKAREVYEAFKKINNI